METNQNIGFEKAKIFNLNNSIEYSEGGIISKQITKQKNGNITLFSFDKGQGLTEHTASFDAIIQIIDGTAEIFINREKYTLQAGEIIIMPANIPHSVNAVERFKMLLTMVKENQ